MSILEELFSSELLQKLLYGIIEYMPRIFGAILLLFLGRFIARKLGKLIIRILRKTKIDHYGDSLMEIPLLSKSRWDLRLSSIIRQFFYYFILLFFIITAIDILHLDAVSKLVSDFISYLPYLFSGLLILIFGSLVANYIQKVVLTACQSLGIPSANIIATIVFYIIFVSVAMSALEQAQFKTHVISNNLTIVLGGIVLAFAIGYGLASKQLVANQLNSLYHKNDIELGEEIQIGDTKGTVVEINSNHIVVEDKSKKVIIPFKRMSEENITIFKG